MNRRTNHDECVDDDSAKLGISIWLVSLERVGALGIRSPRGGGPSIHPEFHRARRYPFAANIALTDVLSERLVTGRTTNLSLFGCYVSTTSPFLKGTKVSLKITHIRTSLTALGNVIYSMANSGMGIAFTKVEPSGQATLEKWIASLRAE